MTRPDIDAIKARAEAATVGPWKTSESREDTELGLSVIYGIKDVCDVDSACDSAPAFQYAEGFGRSDAEFMAEAHTDIPDLIAYIEQLEARINTALRLHQAYGFYAHEDNCLNTSEAHREERHIESTEIGVGEFICLDLHLYDVCDHCTDDEGFRTIEYPCGTRQKLEGDQK